MKKDLILVALLFLFQTSYLCGQTYKFKSKIGDGKEYAEITIDVNGDEVRFERNIYVNTENVKQQFFNISDLVLSDSKFTISEEQKGKYWYIPFDIDPVILFKPNGWSVECHNVYDCTTGECAWQSDGTCDCGSGTSNPCVVTICTNGTYAQSRYSGSGIIVQGNKIIERYALTGPYKYENGNDGLMQLQFECNYSDTDSTLKVLYVPVNFTNGFSQKIYNRTPFPTKINELKRLYVDAPSSENLWFIPFNPSDDISEYREIPYYYECCGGCGNTPGECDWRPASGGCSQCKCPSGYTTVCTTTRTGNGAIARKGGGVIVNVKHVMKGGN